MFLMIFRIKIALNNSLANQARNAKDFANALTFKYGINSRTYKISETSSIFDRIMKESIELDQFDF